MAHEAHPHDANIPLPDPDRVQRTVASLVSHARDRRGLYLGIGAGVVLVIVAALFIAHMSGSEEPPAFSSLWRRCEAARAKLAVNMSATAELAELEAYLDEIKGSSEEGLCLWFLAIYEYREASTEDKATFAEREPHLEKALSYARRLRTEDRFGDLLLAKSHWYTAGSGSPIDDLYNQIERDLDYQREHAQPQPKPSDKYVAVLRTDAGDIFLHFFVDLAPKHVENFLTLARHGIYNGTAFHFVGRDPTEPVAVHGGDPYSFFYNDPLDKKHILRWGKGGIGYDIPPEEARFRVVHREGIVTSLRREAADWDNGSQFQILLGNDPGLDRVHTPFAKVVEGLKVVREAAARKTAAEHGPFKDEYEFAGVSTRDLVVEPVIVRKVVVFEDGKVVQHDFPLADGEKSLSTISKTPVVPLTGDELYGERRLKKPSAEAADVRRGYDVPFPGDVEVAKADPKGERKS